MLSTVTTIDVMAAGHRPGRPFSARVKRLGSLMKDTIVRNWWAVAPSSTKQQIEPEQVRSAQEAVARGKAAPHGIGSAGILILAVLAIVFTLYFGKEILLPIALAVVLKLLLQPVMRLLHEGLRLPGALAALGIL
jgi:hypothetical protein